jgi:hypothetical protein
MKLKVRVELNHGRWVAHCPGCPSAMFIVVPGSKLSEYGPRPEVTTTPPLYVCPRCQNELSDGKPLKYEMPEGWEMIELSVSKRPEQNRNCLPHETVKDLQRENRERGVK